MLPGRLIIPPCLQHHPPAGSLDSIEVDLGSLSLKTARILAQPEPRGHPQLLVEAVDLTFSGGLGSLLMLLAFQLRGCGLLCACVQMPGPSLMPWRASPLAPPTPVPAGVGCSVVQASKRGPNVFRNAESGWRLHWRRPLQPELRGEQPMVGRPLRACKQQEADWPRAPSEFENPGPTHPPSLAPTRFPLHAAARCKSRHTQAYISPQPPAHHTTLPSPRLQFDLSLDLFYLKARLTDHEYELITSVAADNFAGEPGTGPTH